MLSKNRSLRLPILLGLIALLLIHFFFEWIVGRSPILAESYYDEAVTGEMALHILKGEHQLFFWGQPYMGALEPYLTSFLFHLFGATTFVLHLTDILIYTAMIFLVYRIGTLAGGWMTGMLAAAFLTIPPLYLSIVGQLATGGHEEAVLMETFVLFGTCLLAFNPEKDRISLAILIGLLAGLGWWSSLLGAPLLTAGVIGLLVAKPRILLGWVPWAGLGGFFFGSLPFWIWEFFHHFSTFRFFAAGQGGPGISFFVTLYAVLRYSLIESFLGYWWDGQSVLPSVPSFLAWSVFIVVYLPVFFLLLFVIFQWIRRMVSLRNPFQNPKDLVVFTFLILVFIFSFSEEGTHGSLRYSLALYTPFAVLLAFWLRKIFLFRKILGSVALVGLLSFNFFLHTLFLQEANNLPYRPVDHLIKALKDHGIHYAYADNRISQVLTFESREEIICADFFGRRNYNYLRAVDAAPPKEIAIVTHQKLGNPYPETMAAALRLLGGSRKRFEVGSYVFWYDFQEPVPLLRPLSPNSWRIIASREEGQVEMIKDRDLMTSWKARKRAGDSLSVDLGRPTSVARISFLPGPIEYGIPCGFKLETSLDQKKWELVAETSAKDVMGGLYWHQGHPWFDQNPRLQITFSPHPCQYIRITNLTTPENPNEPWTIAELFIYEDSKKPYNPSQKAQEAYHRAEQALNHWMDDPTGPHPLFPNASLETRREQVNWVKTIQALEEARLEAPDWEEVYQLFGVAIDRGGLVDSKGGKNNKTPLNYDILFSKNDFQKISSSRFKVSSNFNKAESGLAIDGDPFTRWSSLKAQEPGMFFQLDLGDLYSVNGFSLYSGDSLNDFPRVLKTYFSCDHKKWEEIKKTSFSEYAVVQNQLVKKTTYRFSPVITRYIHLLQTGEDPVYWWSIYEIEVFGKKR